MVDCPPQVFLVDLDYGCCSAHYLPELADRQSFHLALSRGDCVYLLGGHTLASDSRPPRLFRLRVELLFSSPKLCCDVLDNGLSITSAIATRLGSAHEYNGIRIEPQAPPPWNGEISSSHLWFGGSLGKGHALLAVPAEGNPAPANAFYLYQVSFEQEGAGGEDVLQGYSQESTDMEDSTPLEDSEELYLQCMELPEAVLLRFSQNNAEYFCLDHAGQSHQERTPPRQELPVKRTPMKPVHKKAPIKINMTPAKKSFLRRLFYD
ncbi:hypothetical protein ACEWY4_010936 [Coilia grayii]|uniref:Recombination activating protein 2 PHD domain-containing protein n=1 Tax=Coilia grayii TaxID=363190 RepID=A0ABD1K3A8_9TELE